MNSNDINSIIDNLCNKLGTTASKLIPEMAGYYIAKEAIWLVISLIFIGIAIALVIQLFKMHKQDGKMLALYPDKIRELDEVVKQDYTENLTSWNRTAWCNIVDKIDRVTGTVYYDESSYGIRIMGTVFIGAIGMVIFGVALTKIIGWALSPHAMAFIWIINQIGGGQ